ncbi:MAG: N-acetylneuraminate synthase [Flavobacteriales bacterium]|nr:N-acetylneuraminate synthase [Flavobacteriales bacterium]
MHFNNNIRIADRLISESSPTYIIAEAGVNHNGDIALARQLIDVAVEAKVDAVKFQSFKTESLILESVEKAAYQKVTTGASDSQFQMLKKLEMSVEQMIDLQAYCTERGITFITTPFDEDSLDELDALNLPAYKVSSTDLTNIAFVEKVAAKGKPVILSTAMSYIDEIQEVLRQVHPINQDIIILQCTGNYPTQPENINLKILNTYWETFDMLVGFSDHSAGVGASPFAVARGAKVIEKHFTLDKSMEGPDHIASLDPSELKELVSNIRTVEQYLGNPEKRPTASEEESRKKLQKCLVASKNILAGEFFTRDNIIGKRTGGIGISAMKYKEVIGLTATRDYSINEIIETNS